MKYSKLTLPGILSILLWVCTSCSSAVPDALAPDMVLHGGKIVTVDESFSIAQAVAIKDGRIVAVGSDNEILSLSGADTEVVNLEGKTVLPGFNDSHLHLAWPVGEAPNPAIAELAAARSIGEIVDIVRREVEAASPGELVWIPFGPSIVTQIEEERWPNKYDLDPVSPRQPGHAHLWRRWCLCHQQRGPGQSQPQPEDSPASPKRADGGAGNR